MALDTVAKLRNRPLLRWGIGGNSYNGGPYQWYTGSVGGNATTFPSTRAICTSLNSMFTNYADIDALPGDTYLVEFLHFGNAPVRHNYWLADLLVAAGGFSGTVTTLQTFITPPDLSETANNLANRIGAADYSDVLWFITIQSDLGSTFQAVTMTYTNAAGTPGQTWSPGGIGGGEGEGRFTRRVLPFAPPGGVRSIESGQIGASTGTAGNWGVMAVRPYGMLSCNRGPLPVQGWWPNALTKMPAQACPIVLGEYFGNGVSSCSQMFYAKWVKA